MNEASVAKGRTTELYKQTKVASDRVALWALGVFLVTTRIAFVPMKRDYYLGKKFRDTYEFMGVIDKNIIEFIILLLFMIFVIFYLSNNPAVSWQNDLASLFTW